MPRTYLDFSPRTTIHQLDIREPIFKYYHELENSPENIEGESYGMPLVTRTFQDTRNYWVTLSFPNLPDIYCLDEVHGRFRGIPLEEALKKQSEQNKTLTQITWEHEHFITVIWQGLKILDFDKTLKRLKTVLGPIFPNRPIHADYGNPGPASLCSSSHWRAGDLLEPLVFGSRPF